MNGARMMRHEFSFFGSGLYDLEETILTTWDMTSGFSLMWGSNAALEYGDR